MTTQTITHSAKETIAFGRRLAAELSPPLIVLLRGDLGAGKTTLVKGIAEGFEAALAEDVTSPTFTLVHEYRGPRVRLYTSTFTGSIPRDLETLGLDDLLASNCILLMSGERSSLASNAITTWKLPWGKSAKSRRGKRSAKEIQVTTR